MDDLKADSFTRAKMTLQLTHLEPSTHVTTCACEHPVVLIMRSAGVYSVYTSRRIVGTVFRQSDPSNKKKLFTAVNQAVKNATMKSSNFSWRNSAMMRTTKYAAGFPAAPCTISIVFCGRQRNRILHFLLIRVDQISTCCRVIGRNNSFTCSGINTKCDSSL